MLALMLFETPPGEAERSKEIPVEVVMEQPPDAAPSHKQSSPDATAKPIAPAQATQPPTERSPAPDPSEALPQKLEQKPASEPKPVETKHFEQTATSAPPNAQSRPLTSARKGGVKKSAREKSVVSEKTAPKLAPQPERGGGDESQPTAQAGPALPFDLGPEIFRAVAVPLPTEGGDEPMSYKLIVFGMLERAKHYPEAALERGVRGVSVIEFALDETGGVASVSLLRSSGDADLDAESVALVGRAAPFPAPPPGAQRAFAAEITFGKNQ